MALLHFRRTPIWGMLKAFLYNRSTAKRPISVACCNSCILNFLLAMLLHYAIDILNHIKKSNLHCSSIRGLTIMLLRRSVKRVQGPTSAVSLGNTAPKKRRKGADTVSDLYCIAFIFLDRVLH